MDCPSEEQLIRLKLEAFENISSLHFDIPNRRLEVYHPGDCKPILDVIHAGVLVFVTRTKAPDLIAGAIVFIIVARGAFRILKHAK